jgi:putative endonuclease
MNTYFVYILASKRNGTTYIGVTNDILRRLAEHRSGVNDSFTKDHEVHLLVHVEEYSSIKEAITREKQLKHWKREWKIDLIEKTNPEWLDLADPKREG